MTPHLLVLPADLDHHQVVSDYIQHHQGWVETIDNNPDLHFFNQDGTGIAIADVRQLIADLQYQPYQHSHRVFVLYRLESASLPAQNALLKSLEEPPIYVRFVLTTSKLGSILPTIQSRCVLVKNLTSDQSSNEQTADQDQPPKVILQLMVDPSSVSYSALIELAGTYKDRDQARRLLQTLQNKLLADHQQQPTATTTTQLQVIHSAQQQLDHNVNVKLALEHCLFEIKKL